MYVPFAFDLVRVEQERLRRSTSDAKRGAQAASVADEATGRSWTPRRFHRRAATAC